jgi:hypothetical protein
MLFLFLSPKFTWHAHFSQNLAPNSEGLVNTKHLSNWVQVFFFMVVEMHRRVCFGHLCVDVDILQPSPWLRTPETNAQSWGCRWLMLAMISFCPRACPNVIGPSVCIWYDVATWLQERVSADYANTIRVQLFIIYHCGLQYSLLVRAMCSTFHCILSRIVVLPVTTSYVSIPYSYQMRMVHSLTGCQAVVLALPMKGVSN